MGFDPAKLQKFLKSKGVGAAASSGTSSTATGGKGTVRRKHKAVRKAASHDDKRLKATLSKLNVRDIPAIEEVNLFKADGMVIHFASPKVQASIASNTYVVSGNAETKKLQDLLPGIINQLGPDNLEDLKKIYANYKGGEGLPAGLSSLAGLGLGGAAPAAGGDDDDDVPDLVENFEEVSKAPAPKAEAPKAAPVPEVKKVETPAPKKEEAKPVVAAAEPVVAKKEEAKAEKKGSAKPKAEKAAEPKVEAKPVVAEAKKDDAPAPKVEKKGSAKPKAEATPAPKAETVAPKAKAEPKTPEPKKAEAAKTPAAKTEAAPKAAAKTPAAKTEGAKKASGKKA